VWRKSVFDIYFTEIGAALTTVLPVLFKYCFKYCCSDRRKLIVILFLFFAEEFEDKGNNKITELRAILQRESQNS
jgi:hypothetical protein